MQIAVYATKDLKTAHFGNVFFEIEPQNAIRSFITATRQTEGKIGQFPQDFELHKISDFDNSNGKFKDLDTTELMISGIECRKLDEEINRKEKNA